MEKAVTAIPSTLEEILKWSESLDMWQRDALRRFFSKNEILEADVNEIQKIMKIEYGLIDPIDTGIVPDPLKINHIPIRATESSSIILQSMHDLNNVNQIDPKQGIKFNDKGITIIYGENATGKSGYARVLKKACHARGEAKPILPNVFSDDAIGGPANAIIEVLTSKGSKPINWVDTEGTTSELAGIAVFDSSCERVYVDRANQVAYVPYGLDVFDKLGKLCEQNKSFLQREMGAVNTSKEFIQEIRPGTSVAKLIDEMTHKTQKEEIEKIVDLSETEQKRLLEIEKKLSEIKLNDPKKIAETLLMKKRRIESIGKTFENINGYLSKEKIKAIKDSQIECMAAEKAVQLSSESSLKEELFPGIMSELWKRMFNAAKDYSEKYAYPGEAFPVVKKGASCVLCLHALDEDAAKRLSNFKKYVQDETQKILKAKKEKYSTEVDNIKSMVKYLEPINNDLMVEIKEIDAEVPNIIMKALSAANILYKNVIECIESQKWIDIPELSNAPKERIQAIADSLALKAKEYEKINNSRERSLLENEYNELISRKTLYLKKSQIISYLSNLKILEKYKECIKSTNTYGISKKGSEMMEKAITDQLKVCLKKEFASLKVNKIKVDLNKTGRAGVVFHQLKLQSKFFPEINLSDVLSEGEQRAIALASFLSELHTSPSKCGIIFDDPVSSLDQNRRENVALRLVEESKKRQVIIFTHDLVFFVALRCEAEKQDVSCLVQNVWSNDTSSGLCDSDAPWCAMKVKDRMTYIRNTVLIEVKRAYKSGEREQYEINTEKCYKKLRETCERSIEEILFADSIERFRPSIETTRLKGVTFTDDDYKFIERVMSKYSGYVHDQALVKGGRMPDPDELERDINELDEYITKIRKRNENTSKNR